MKGGRAGEQALAQEAASANLLPLRLRGPGPAFALLTRLSCSPGSQVMVVSTEGELSPARRVGPAAGWWA